MESETQRTEALDRAHPGLGKSAEAGVQDHLLQFLLCPHPQSELPLCLGSAASSSVGGAVPWLSTALASHQRVRNSQLIKGL